MVVPSLLGVCLRMGLLVERRNAGGDAGADQAGDGAIADRVLVRPQWDAAFTAGRGAVVHAPSISHARAGGGDASREISCLLLCLLQNECSGRRWCDEPEQIDATPLRAASHDQIPQ